MEPPQSPPRTYKHSIEQLASSLPHLVNVQQDDCRHPQSGEISCYDISISTNKVGLVKSIGCADCKDEELTQVIQSFATINDPTDIKARIIMIEDLSVDLISALGSIFRISPEFFETHLHRSGYGEKSYNEPDLRTWNTRLIENNFISFQWYRPVLRKYAHPLDLAERMALVQGHGVRWEEEKQIAVKEGGKLKTITKRHELLTTTNIFRQEWLISTNPRRAIPTKDHRIPGLWEERVSLLCTEIAGITTEYREEIELARREEQRRQTEIPFAPFFPRGPRPVMSQDILESGSIAELGSYLGEICSMKEDVIKWMTTSSHSDANSNPLTAVLLAVRTDISSLSNTIDMILEKISLDSVNDDLIQERVSHWRNVVSRLQVNLTSVKKGLKSFSNFGCPFIGDETLLRTMSAELDNLLKHIETTHAALRSDLSIVESKRGIHEAESVSKLTELAFLFIPLTFVASLFSMQVSEMSNGVSLWVFIVTACVAITISYCIRLFARSALLTNMKDWSMNQAREYGGVNRTERLTTRGFMAWLINLILGEQSRYIPALLLFFPVISTSIFIIAFVSSKSDDPGTTASVVVMVVCISLTWCIGISQF